MGEQTVGADSDNASPEPRAVLKSLIAPVYIPWLGMAICLGMVSLALPLYLDEIGLGYFALSTILAAAGLGSALAGVPAGDGLARFGVRATLFTALAALAGSTLALAGSDEVIVLFILQFIAGAAAVALRLAGQSWITQTVDVGLRGRALSGMGGLRRFGIFVGPILAGVTIELFGYVETFALAGFLAAAGLLALLTTRSGRSHTPPVRIPLLRVLSKYWRQLLIVTSGPIMIMAVRRGRNVLLPLIGDDIGISPVAVGLLVGVSTGADLLLFPVAGFLMDRFGRLTAIVPAFSLMGLGMLALGFADSGTTVALAGGLIGVGNGLSAGTMMTLGSDLAPEESVSQFLAAFASLQDWGGVLGPLIVGWTATAVGLGASAMVLSGIMFVGVILIVVTVGETGSPTTSQSTGGSTKPSFQR